MAETPHNNGYVKLTTLVSVAVPILLIFTGAVSLFVALSIAPVQKQLDQYGHDQEIIRGDIVPRKEHDRDWASQDARFSKLQREIDENKSDIKSIYTPSDALKTMSDRLNKLEADLHERDRQK